MALTVLTAINRAIERLGEGERPVIDPADAQALIPDALKRFAEIVAQNSELAPLLRTDFSVTVSSGTGSLTTALTASEPLLAKFLPMAYVVTSTGVQLHYLPDRTQLGLSRSNILPYYCNDKGTIRTRNTDGSLTSLSTTLTITGQYSPTISNVPTQIEELFIDVLAGMIQARTQQPEAA
jgi:hypothetical protein